MSRREHWQEVWAAKASDRQGWFQARPEPSLALIVEALSEKGASVIDVSAVTGGSLTIGAGNTVTAANQTGGAIDAFGGANSVPHEAAPLRNSTKKAAPCELMQHNAADGMLPQGLEP